MRVRGRFDGRRSKLQGLLLAVIVTYLFTTVPGIRAALRFSWWMDGLLQNVALESAALLCLARVPRSAPDRVARRIVAIGLVLNGVANTSSLFVGSLDPAVPAPADAFRLLGFYPCLFVALLLLVHSRTQAIPLHSGMDGVLVGLGTVTVAAAVALPSLMAVLQASVTASVTDLAFPILDLILMAFLLSTASALCWRPPPGLWLLGGALTIMAVADTAHLVQMTENNHQSGGYVDAASVVAVTAIAIALGWRKPARPAVTQSAWLPLAGPVSGAAAAVVVLTAGNFRPLTPAAVGLAVITLGTTLCRLTVAFVHANRAGKHAALAQIDDLTLLLNRRGFYERTAGLLPGGQRRGGLDSSCALLLLDLDHFKDVNDSLGHAVGDQLLQVVATRLSAPLREQDTLVRLGGDEFAVLLPEVGVADEALAVASTLSAALDQGVELDGLCIQTGASIGIALCPQHGRDIGSLLRRADIAMYRAKRTRARHLVYTPDQDGQANTRDSIELLGRLRHAIDNDGLTLHYQPKVSLTTGGIVGVEALVRWEHPSRGLLYPDEFLPLVRQNSLMQAVTSQVVERALSDAAGWYTQGHRIPVAINLFPPTLVGPDLPAHLADALALHDLPSTALTVEIGEDFLTGNVDRARAVLVRLQALGIRIAIDNFGSGYSALSYLRELPIDEVKLDRSVVAPIATDARDASIVRSVIDLAHTLGLTTVAEGVERADTAAVLHDYGCDTAQGHLYSRPIAHSGLLQLLNRLRPVPGPEIAPASPGRDRHQFR